MVGQAGSGEEAAVSDARLEALASPLLESGVAVVAITLGASGAYVAVTEDAERLRRGEVLRGATSSWRPGSCVRLPALPVRGELNANGAGDAFTAGMLAAMLWREGGEGEGRAEGRARCLSLETTVRVALASARQRVDGSAEKVTIGKLLEAELAAPQGE